MKLKMLIKNLRNKFFISLLLCLSILLIVFAYKQPKPIHPNIKTIHSFEEALPLLKNIHDKTLVLFDIDDTLIRGYDIGMANGGDLPISFIIGALLKHPSLIIKTKWEYYYSIMWKNAKRFVIEPYVVQLINNLKDNGALVLGLTLIESRTFGIIRDFSEFRYKMLKNLGIQMSENLGNFYFTDLRAYRYNYPELYKGIIFTNRLNKAKVLNAFIEQFDLNLNKIIYFDDKIKNLNDIAYECDKLKIPFQGFLYQAKKKFLENKFSTQRALLELDYLIKYEKWLTNDQADAILKKS